MLGLRNSLVPPFKVAKDFNLFRGREKGVTLIEALIALAILSIIAIPFLGGLATASKASFIADERGTARSLAQSQLEYVKSQSYINYTDPGHGDYGLIVAPAAYSIEIIAVPIDLDTGQPLPSGQDDGVQKITVTIRHQGEKVITLEGYKVSR